MKTPLVKSQAPAVSRRYNTTGETSPATTLGLPDLGGHPKPAISRHLKTGH